MHPSDLPYPKTSPRRRLKTIATGLLLTSLGFAHSNHAFAGDDTAVETPAEVDAEIVDVLKIGERTTIKFVTTEVPELTQWVRDDLMPVCEQWYPKIREKLASNDFEAPTDFSVTFKKDMRGVAYTSGQDVVGAGSWYKRNKDGEGIGSIVHELVHVVQQYRMPRQNRPPGWLVEGIADHIRWYQFEPVEKRRQINWQRSNYDDAYFPSATFLNHIIETYDEDALKKINAACRQGRYTDELWTKFYGKTAQELWDEAKPQQ